MPFIGIIQRTGKLPPAVIALFLLFMFSRASAQNDFTLEQCRAMARATFSAEKQMEWISESATAQQRLLKKMITPNVSAFAYTAYLSEVPDPAAALEYAFDFSHAPRERLKAGLFLSQQVYDGGEYRLKREEIKLNARLEEQKTEESLLQIDHLVDEVFFGIALARKGLQVLEIQQDIVSLKLSDARSLAGEGKLLKKELLYAEMALIDVETRVGELKAEERKYRRMLSELTGQEMGTDDRLVAPVRDETGDKFVDPAFLQLGLQEKKNELARNLSRTAALPKVRLFSTLGYGKPGLNFFENRFDWFGGVGLVMQVPITGWRDHAREDKILHIESNRLREYRDALQKRRDVIEIEHSGEIYRYETLEQQQAIAIEKKGQLRQQMEILLKEGEVSLSDYFTVLNEETAAKLKLEVYAISKTKEIIKRDRILVNHSNYLEK